MTGLIDAVMNRQRTVLSALVVMLVAGLITYINIPKEADPDIPIPIIHVAATHEGISPEDAERLILKPLETKLRSIEGLKELRSNAAEGYAGVLLEFDVDFDKEKALTDVREQVDLAKPDLPDDTNEPIVREFNTSLFPVIVVTLSGKIPERTLLHLAQRLEDRIEQIPSVLTVELRGHREELLEVVIDPVRLESYSVTQAELFNAVALNNRLVAAGALDTGRGRFAVKVPGLFETHEDVMSLPIKTSGEGVVTLSDIAEIRRTFKDANRFARLNGEPSIAIEVTKRIGENIIETTEAVRAAVDPMAETFPAGVTVTYTQDASRWINSMLDGLESSVMTAIALVMVVVVAALGLRSAGLVGVAIPSSFLIGFLFLGIMGLTVNMMVMFGLILAVGLLVDGAIVVVEYADRKMTEGMSSKEAFALAAKRMFWPIVSSTATTLAAFAPMLLWPGVSGKFMSYLPITLIFVLTASLFVALIFLPVMGSVFGKAGSGDPETLKSLAAAEHGDLRSLPGFTGFYARVLYGATKRPGLVILAAVTLLIGVVMAYGRYGKGVEFFTDTENEYAAVMVSARGNLSAEETRDLVFEVERIVRGVEGIQNVYTATGGAGAMGRRSSVPKDIIGRVNIELEPWEQRDRRSGEILSEIRELTRDLSGLRVEVRAYEEGPRTGKDIQIEIASSSEPALIETTALIRRHLEQEMFGVVDLEDTRPLPGIEWELTIDREQAGRFGADVTQVGGVVQLVTNGIKVGEYRPDDSEEEVDIRVRFPQEYRNFDQIDQLRIPTREGLVPMANFVVRKAKPQVDTIERVDGTRVMYVRANTIDGVLVDDKVNEIRDWLSQKEIDPRVEIRFRGADEEQQAAIDFLSKAFAGALFLMALILITQFNSFYHAVLILSSVVLSTVGVLLGMLVTGQTFSVIMTGTGIVALAGIVVNNNIVLIDTYQRLVKSGFDPMDAVMRTGAQRLRPVLLTTITTICGLLPMMLMISIDFIDREIIFNSPQMLWWVKLATAVIYGLGFATVLTLVVTPSALALPIRLKRGRIAGLIARLRGRKATGTPSPTREGAAHPAE